MDIEVRPATKTEQMYCYTQSDQIMGQTGCIGHLRADMGDSGDQSFMTGPVIVRASDARV